MADDRERKDGYQPRHGRDIPPDEGSPEPDDEPTLRLPAVPDAVPYLEQQMAALRKVAQAARQSADVLGEKLDETHDH
ncbi:hypothetical protein ACIBHX_30875 [Nonomuraea sp. NPDC050536]|uniref:hypothetical protein n=1 Tax=Nonomuraea sp. NPDC050536 TaxID=3364366 RepID=UPI0037C4F5C3